jgi:hypothetical protein
LLTLIIKNRNKQKDIGLKRYLDNEHKKNYGTTLGRVSVVWRQGRRWPVWFKSGCGIIQIMFI